MTIRIQRKKLLSRTILFLVLCLLTVLFALPFLYMLSAAFKTPQQNVVYPPTWIPNPFTLRAFQEGSEAFNYFQSLLNSCIITGLSILGNLLSTTLVAYGFARLNARLRNFWFAVLLSTMLVPWIVTFIPVYIFYAQINWINTYLPLIVPYFLACNAFSVFLFRQFFLSIPKELDEAAKIDGCSTMGVLYRIILPNSKPVLFISAIFVFINSWNDFFAPLIFLNDPDKYTLAVGLAIWNSVASGNFGSRVMDPSPLMAMSLLTVIPIMILYFFSQRYFIQGIVTTGLKG